MLKMILKNKMRVIRERCEAEADWGLIWGSTLAGGCPHIFETSALQNLL